MRLNLKNFSGHLMVLGMAFSVFMPVGYASSLMTPSIQQMSRSARSIYRVEVLGQSVEEKRGFLWTVVEVKVLESYKNAKPISGYTKIYIPGGKPSKKSAAVRVAGAPELRSGSEYILFLDKHLSETEANVLDSWTSFLVSVDGSTGERFVLSIEEKPDLQRSHGGHRDLHRSSSKTRVRTYDSFVSEVFESLN